LKISVALLPDELPMDRVASSQVVVFDVLRATSTVTTAMAAGAKRIHFFADVEDARAAQRQFPDALLCGERGCLKVPGFDLGNSPLEFTRGVVAGRRILMSTTNGTRAIHAARRALRLFAGSLLNAHATAAALSAHPEDIILLCAGTNGRPALEDLIGAGAVIHRLRQMLGGDALHVPDLALAGDYAFCGAAANLESALLEARGAQNLVAAGLAADIRHCSQLNALPTAVLINGAELATA
jgi:2-phosphosulfolactate phosphatase